MEGWMLDYSDMETRGWWFGLDSRVPEGVPPGYHYLAINLNHDFFLFTLVSSKCIVQDILVHLDHCRAVLGRVLQVLARR
jgi:hypothetical protein